MPTLAEILAKKKATVLPPESKPKTADTVEAKSAGQESSTPAGGAGMVIRAEDEKAKLAASIKQTLDASAPKPAPPLTHSEKRELGAMENGERIPMDHPTPEDGEAGQEWFRCLHSFETTLGIVIEPNGEHAWIAVKATKFEKPLLIQRLPLLNHIQGTNPF